MVHARAQLPEEPDGRDVAGPEQRAAVGHGEQLAGLAVHVCSVMPGLSTSGPQERATSRSSARMRVMASTSSAVFGGR